ncbi:HNH endonuclease [Streptomyces sp. NBC_00365]|uniref:HNH endonuclease n=1 Tax=Streptomyces sp. NBC_00365 TaxID=2975726 RepID=UPI002254BB0F|nr:HNH endonuclease [Streptomyces sp. NBC_00365]MCX5097412.1 HNH endonuclease [Streptomyces sp. NBC_00365]
MACSTWLKNYGYAGRVNEHLLGLVELEHRYRQAGNLGILHSFLLVERIKQTNHRDRAMFEETYGQAMVGRAAGRTLYDALKALAADTRCPLCGVQAVAQVDHHAPKDKFPLLALTPLNLVAVCGTCNQAKSNTFDLEPAREAIHPYFDDLGADRWLFAHIDSAAGGVAVFQAKPPGTWPHIKAARLQRHFTKYHLADRYRAEAGHALSIRKRKDTRTLEESGPGGLRDQLLADADEYADYDPNSWQAALIFALADSSWYLNGGMRGI